MKKLKLLSSSLGNEKKWSREHSIYTITISVANVPLNLTAVIP